MCIRDRYGMLHHFWYGMELSTPDMLTHLKQRAMIEFLRPEKVNASDIHHRLKAIYGDKTVDGSTVSRWAIQFCASEAGKANIEDEPHLSLIHI